MLRVYQKIKLTKYNKENLCPHLLSTLKYNTGFIRIKHAKNKINFRLKIDYNYKATKIFSLTLKKTYLIFF